MLQGWRFALALAGGENNQSSLNYITLYYIMKRVLENPKSVGDQFANDTYNVMVYQVKVY